MDRLQHDFQYNNILEELAAMRQDGIISWEGHEIGIQTIIRECQDYADSTRTMQTEWGEVEPQQPSFSAGRWVACSRR